MQSKDSKKFLKVEEENFEGSTQTLLPDKEKSSTKTLQTHSLDPLPTLAVAGVISQQYDFESSRYKDHGKSGQKKLQPQAAVSSLHLNAIASMNNNSRKKAQKLDS